MARAEKMSPADPEPDSEVSANPGPCDAAPAATTVWPRATDGAGIALEESVASAGVLSGTTPSACNSPTSLLLHPYVVRGAALYLYPRWPLRDEPDSNVARQVSCQIRFTATAEHTSLGCNTLSLILIAGEE